MTKVYIIMEQFYFARDHETETLHSIYLTEIDAAREVVRLNAEIENHDYTSHSYYYTSEEVK